MLEKMIALLERFVVAHESIAKSLASTPVYATLETKEVAVSEEKPAKVEQKAEAKEEPAAEEKPKRTRTRSAAKKEEPKVDLKALREEILEIDDAITDGDVDEAADEFDDLMDDYGINKLPEIKDEDVEAFVIKARKIIAKYYEEK